MEKYFRHHTLTIVVVLVGFFLLAVGELFLYRKVMVVNEMVSEGLMQIKEAAKPPPPQPTIEPTIFKFK